MNPDPLILNIETNDKLTYPNPKSETLENVVEGILDGMSRSPEKRHNLVVTQLIESLSSPLEYIKGGNSGGGSAIHSSPSQISNIQSFN